MKNLSYDLLMQVFRSGPGATVVGERAGEEWLVVSANEAFEHLAGLGNPDLRGRDLKLLQDKHGALLWPQMQIVPARDAAGNANSTHFIGYYRDAGASGGAGAPSMQPAQMQQAAGNRDNFTATNTYPSLLSVLRDDRVTGLHNKAYFDELMRRDWAIAQRDKRQLTLFLFDIDALGTYNDTFGRQAGDSCIKRVARVIAGCLRRGSDLTARLEGGTIAALIQGMTEHEALKHANGILERVREQKIHHPRAVQKFVTVSGGFVSLIPGGEQKPEEMLEKGQEALKEAKATGRNRLALAST